MKSNRRLERRGVEKEEVMENYYKEQELYKKEQRNDLMGIGFFFLWIGLLIWLYITK